MVGLVAGDRLLVALFHRGKRAFGALRSSDRGGAVVEFALVFPLLFFVMAAMIEFGILLINAMVASDGASAGATLARTCVTSSSPACWSNAASPPSSSIQGAILSIFPTANDDNHISITYWITSNSAGGTWTDPCASSNNQTTCCQNNVGAGAFVLGCCAYYSASSNSVVVFTGSGHSTGIGGDCMQPNTNTIKVQVQYTYYFKTPMVSTIIGAGSNGSITTYPTAAQLEQQ